MCIFNANTFLGVQDISSLLGACAQVPLALKSLGRSILWGGGFRVILRDQELPFQIPDISHFQFSCELVKSPKKVKISTKRSRSRCNFPLSLGNAPALS